MGRLSNARAVPIPVAVYDDGIYTPSTVQRRQDADLHRPGGGPAGSAGHPLRPQFHGRRDQHHLQASHGGTFYAEARATLANYNHTTVELAVSGPLEPGLQFRLAGSWDKQRDGYFKNVVPGMPSEGNVVDTFYLEGQLQAKFGDHMDGWAKVSATGWNNGSGGPGARAGFDPGPFGFGEFAGQYVNSGFACAPGGVVTNVVNTSPFGCVNPASQDPRKFASNVAQTVSLDETYGVATNLTYHFDDMDLKYIGGGLNYHYILDSDNGGGSIVSLSIPLRQVGPTLPTCSLVPGCTALTIHPKFTSTYQVDYHNISHELDLTSTGPGALQWVGGLYYYREGYRQPVFTTQPETAALDGPITPTVSRDHRAGGAGFPTPGL